MVGAKIRHRPAARRYELPPDATAVPLARAHTRRLLTRWRLPAVLEPLTLVVSELVGNAVRHGRPPFQLLLRRVEAGVRVDVHDESPGTEPILRRGTSGPPEPDGENGRGLFLVDSVSTDTGVDQIPDDGKRVWAVVEPR